MRHIVLDSYPLSLVSAPARTANSIAAANWLMACLAAGHKVYIPEVIDYELRRELLRASKVNSIQKLNRLKGILRFVPINSSAMLLAAELWAKSRQDGLVTGDPKKLDIDVILAAQVLTLDVAPSDVVVATSNVSHLSWFVSAELWTNIQPSE